MGVTEQLKKLHKQKKIRTSDIPRVVNSGVDVDTYLNRARALGSYINPTQEDDEPVEATQVQPVAMNVMEEPKVETKPSTTKTTTSTRKRSIIRDL